MVNPTRTHDRVRLTKRIVDAAKPADREYILWDIDIAGFGLRVMPGGRKTYLLKYRVGGGRGGQPRKPALGVHGKITAEEARDLAKDWRRRWVSECSGFRRRPATSVCRPS